jgi:hypothetical protein
VLDSRHKNGPDENVRPGQVGEAALLSPSRRAPGAVQCARRRLAPRPITSKLSPRSVCEIRLRAEPKAGELDKLREKARRGPDVNGQEIRRAHRCFEALVSGQVSSVAELATVEGVSDRYVSSLLPLALLAPDIVEAIASGRQPPELTAHRLIRTVDLPIAWAAQTQLHPRGGDWHDEAGVVLADPDAVQPADINIFGIGRAGVHADAAADDDPGVGLAQQLQRRAVGRILAQAEADRRGAAAEGQVPAGPAARRRALPPLPKRRPPNRSEWSPRESAGREPPRSARWQRHAFGRSFVQEGSAAFNPGTPIGDLITPPAHHQEGAADRRVVRG